MLITLSEGLFSKAMAGTKYLVEEYHETVARALNLICDSRIIEEENEVDHAMQCDAMRCRNVHFLSNMDFVGAPGCEAGVFQ